MGNPPRATAGLGRPLSGDIDGGRGFAWRRSPVCDAPGVAVALKLRGLAQQVKGADVLLTEGLGWVEVRRRVTVNNGRRWRRVGLRGKVDAEALWPSGHCGSTRGDPSKVLWGLGRSGDHRQQGIARAE
jgi:hypothetical protein